MGILRCDGVDASSPFCDGLTLTFPSDHAEAVVAALHDRLPVAFGREVSPGVWRLAPLRSLSGPEAGGWMLEERPKAPIVRTTVYGAGVYGVNLSGQAVEALRAVKVYVPLLADFSALPHRVTKADISVDLPVPGPVAIPTVWAAADSGVLKLGRKTVPRGDSRQVLGRDSRGDLTGTVYIRDRKAEISAAVYDKRFERENAGLSDLGPCTRVELRVKAVGMTLRDACVPSGVYWNYAHTLVDRPDGAADWSANGVGFDLPDQPPPDYWRILQSRVDQFVELDAWARVADKLGEYGRRMLLGLVARRLGLKLTGEAYGAV